VEFYLFYFGAFFIEKIKMAISYSLLISTKLSRWYQTDIGS